MKSTEDQLRKYGFDINSSSSLALHNSIQAMTADLEPHVLRAVISLCTRPMKTAEYMCPGAFDDDEPFGHYALNMPFYTHFTSPIRRYPDVLVSADGVSVWHRVGPSV